MSNRVSKLVALLILAGAVSAPADWDPGDPFKMHYPQLPDPNGWDVSWDNKYLADDFLCTETGPITGIHFWVSWKDDLPDWGAINNIRVSLHNDIPADPMIPGSYSRPADPPLFESDLGDAAGGLWTFRPYGDPSLQGWYDPANPPAIPNDHFSTWQINVPNLTGWEQVAGNIYWLSVRMDMDFMSTAQIGWKTAVTFHFNDDATWSASPPFTIWEELRDPIRGDSLDLAFVIVPEPATGALALLFGAAVFAARRLRRHRV